MSSAAVAGGSKDDVVAGSSSSARQEKLDRLRELRLKMNASRKMNHDEVVEEDRRNKLPQNFEAKRRRVEWEEGQEQMKKDCIANGEDYNRVKMLDISSSDAEKWDRAKKAKRNPDQGFSDYEQATFRQYQRLTKQMKPSMDTYKREKEKLGDAFYAGKDTLGVLEHKDSEEAVDRMVDDLEKQIEKRSKFSRRRAHDEEQDIDYINERNMKFNKKLERFYGTYTTEIKQNLERGTAV